MLLGTFIFFLNESSWFLNPATQLHINVTDKIMQATVFVTQMSLNIDNTHAGGLGEAACSVNTGPGATGIQAHTAFHPESLSQKHRPTREDVGTHCTELWPFAMCDSFLRKMSLHMTQQACLWIFADSSRDCWEWRTVAASSTLFRCICFVDDYSPSSQT